MIDEAKLDELAAKAKAVTQRPADTFGRALLDLEEAFIMAADPETIAVLVAEVKRWRAVRSEIDKLPRHYNAYTPARLVTLTDVLAIIDAAAGEGA